MNHIAQACTVHQTELLNQSHQHIQYGYITYVVNWVKKKCVRTTDDQSDIKLFLKPKPSKISSLLLRTSPNDMSTHSTSRIQQHSEPPRWLEHYVFLTTWGGSVFVSAETRRRSTSRPTFMYILIISASEFSLYTLYRVPRTGPPRAHGKIRRNGMFGRSQLRASVIINDLALDVALCQPA